MKKNKFTNDVLKREREYCMMENINILTLLDEIQAVELSGFGLNDEKAVVTFCLTDSGVAIYPGIMNTKPFHYVEELMNGKCTNQLIYLLLKERGLSKENYFIKAGKSYIEAVPHPYIED